MKYNLLISDQKYEVEVGDPVNGNVTVTVNGNPFEVDFEVENQTRGVSVSVPKVTPVVSDTAGKTPPPTLRGTKSPVAQSGAVLAPISGLILDIKVKVGDTVKVGQTVAILEAMKMENNLTTSIGGKVKEINVMKGNEVANGDVIMVIC